MSGAQALVGTRIVDGLAGGLIITDIGGGYVEIEPLSDPMPPIAGDWTLTFEELFNGTALDGGGLVSAGGLVLNVTALGATVAEAQARAYGAVERIQFPGGFCRRDIGARAIGLATVARG